MNHVAVDGPDAPWNQIELPEEEIEVTVSVTLSKTVKVRVNDYKVINGVGEDGPFSGIDYSECNLHKAVEDQIVLPQNLAEFTERIFNEHSANLKAVGMPKHLENAITDCKDWYVDDMEVILE